MIYMVTINIDNQTQFRLVSQGYYVPWDELQKGPASAIDSQLDTTISLVCG